jgi:glycosyltransferase involved in cell wall biosynthesis
LSQDHKINLLHTIGHLGFGGLEGGVVKVVNKIDRKQFLPFLIAITGFNEHGRRLLGKDVRFHGLTRKPGRDWGLVCKLAAYFVENKIDVVHSHNWETWLYSYLAARLARVPVFIHGEHGRDTEKLADDWRKKQVKTFLARHSDHLTTVSQDIMDLMVAQWRVAREKITVVPNGIDLARFYPPASREEAKAKVGLPRQSFVIGTVVGSIRPVKDLPTLVRAFAKIRQKHSRAELAIVGGKGAGAGGGSSDTLELKNLARDLGVASAVSFFGPRHDVDNFMRAFDVYANSSVYEGMSNTLLEAMGCGAAIAATCVGGTPMIVRDGYNGLLVPAKSPEALAAAICRLVESPQLHKILIENGSKQVATRHCQESFVDVHARLYRDAYLRKRPRA